MANDWDIGRLNVLLELFSDWSGVNSFDELIAVLGARMHWILSYDQLIVVTFDGHSESALSIEEGASQFAAIPLASVHAPVLVTIRSAMATATPGFDGEGMTHIAYPLSTSSEKLGAICLISTAGYSYRDMRMIHHVAENLSNVLGRLQQGRLAEDERSARREAEAANQAKDEFLAILGHELRNLLAPILTATELLKRRQGEVPELNIIQRQARHMHRLVDDMLDVTRLTRGGVQLKTAPLDLRFAIRLAVEVSTPIVESHGHALRFALDDDALMVHGDLTRLSQVFANLLNNAALYTPDGGVIEVTAKRVGEEIEVTVRDSGRGISADLLKKVFSPFVQGKQGLARDSGGLGLGLAIARSLVELHGGTIAVASAGEGLGSLFTVRLHALDAPRQPAPLQASPPAEMPNSGQALRVLIVDDNIDLADMVACMISDAGHVVDVAYDPLVALSHVPKSAPDVALLDIGLPGMDGYTLARRIIELTTPKSPKLIAITGYGTAADRARSFAAGFNEHLTKPVDFDCLLAIVAASGPSDTMLEPHLS